MIQSIRKLLVFCMLCIPFAHAEELPSPANVEIEGDVLTWDAVEGATGYNIYFGVTAFTTSYFTTVRGTTQYRVNQTGTYRVVAFDDNGNFGVHQGSNPAVEYTDASGSVSVTTSFYTSIVRATCQNVGPGESCVASCGSTSTLLEPGKVTLYLSGGGCATSDIVEADAFISRIAYECTVPTFSGEVVAQAICVHR